MYVPVTLCLITGKTWECYYQAFHWITTTVKAPVLPKYVGIDFELNFIQVVQLFFPDALVIGCFFHFKTAGRDKIEKIGIPVQEMKAAMSLACSMFEYLLVMDPDDLDPKGIDFVMASLKEALQLQDGYKMPKLSVELWKQFGDTSKGKFCVSSHLLSKVITDIVLVSGSDRM